MTHRDGLPRFSARSVRRGDAAHREACATLSESLGIPPLRSLWVIISDPWYNVLSAGRRLLDIARDLVDLADARADAQDVAPHGYTIDRATMRQRKTGRPVKFETTEQTRQAVDDYLKAVGKRPGEYLFTGRRGKERCLTTRQPAGDERFQLPCGAGITISIRWERRTITEMNSEQRRLSETRTLKFMRLQAWQRDNAHRPEAGRRLL